jgi:hypothetical protein
MRNNTLTEAQIVQPLAMPVPAVSTAQIQCRWVPGTMDRISISSSVELDAQLVAELNAELSVQEFQVLAGRQPTERLYLSGKVTLEAESELGLWLSIRASRA